MVRTSVRFNCQFGLYSLEPAVFTLEYFIEGALRSLLEPFVEGLRVELNEGIRFWLILDLHVSSCPIGSEGGA